MGMDWPTFQEYNPDAKKTHKAKCKQQPNTDVYRLNKVFHLILYYFLIFWQDGEITKDGGEISVTTMGSVSGEWSDEDDEGVPVK